MPVVSHCDGPGCTRQQIVTTYTYQDEEGAEKALLFPPVNWAVVGLAVYCSVDCRIAADTKRRHGGTQ